MDETRFTDDDTDHLLLLRVYKQDYIGTYCGESILCEESTALFRAIRLKLHETTPIFFPDVQRCQFSSTEI